MTEEGTQIEEDGHAFLQHQPNPRLPPVRIALESLPYIIGRGSGTDFTVHSRQISKEHAEIDLRRRRYLLRDLGSRNGTYLNGRRIEEPTPLAHGDIIHVASTEFVFGVGPHVTDSSGDSTIISEPELEDEAFKASRDLFRILAERAVRSVFQPIVTLDGAARVGYEALGRGALGDRILSPIDLFRAASARGRADALSRLMRDVALLHAPSLPAAANGDTRLFINLHPAEMSSEELTTSLSTIPPRLAPGHRAIIEIHESAVTDLNAMRNLRAELKDLGIGLAYDDFGAGQSRLRELAEVPPEVIKIDRSLVQEIEQSTARQGLVRALVRVMLDLGVEVLAEGIETEAEASVCAELGCTLGQGYYFCRPAAVDQL